MVSSLSLLSAALVGAHLALATHIAPNHNNNLNARQTPSPSPRFVKSVRKQRRSAAYDDGMYHWNSASIAQYDDGSYKWTPAAAAGSAAASSTAVTTSKKSRSSKSKTASASKKTPHSKAASTSASVAVAPKATTTPAATTSQPQRTVAVNAATTTTTPAATTGKAATPTAAAKADAGGSIKYTSTYPGDYTGAAATVAANLLANVVPTPASTRKAAPGVLYQGELSYYNPAGGYGSCQVALTEGNKVPFVALSLYEWMGTTPSSAHCFDCVEIHLKSDPSKSVTAMVADSCQACTMGHVDAEQQLFEQLGDASAGVLDIGWSFVTCPSGFTQEALGPIYNA